MIFEEYSHLRKRPIDVSLVVDQSDRFKEVYHFHSGIEMIYVHEGNGKIMIEQNVYRVMPGTLLFLRPFQPHFLQMEITPHKRYVRSLIKYEPMYIKSYLKSFSHLHHFHHYLCHAPAVIQIQQHLRPSLLDRFLKQYAEQFSDAPTTSQQLIERNTVFLVAFYQFILPLWKKTENRNVTFATEPAVVQVMKWIESHFHEDFKLETLAEAVHLSPNHLSYVFKKSTGTTITSILTVRRLRHAALLLKNSDLSIQEIGQQSGYPNFPYFCQVFKKHMGVSPSQYRTL